MPPRDQPAVDLLDLIGHLAPGARLGAGAGGGAQLVSERGIAAEPFELRRQGEHVAEGEEQSALPLGEELAVDLEVRGNRDGAGGERLPHQPRGSPHPARRQAGDVRPGEELRRLAVPRADDAEPFSKFPADTGQWVRRPIEPDHPFPVETVGQPPEGPEQQAQRAAFLLRAVGDSHPTSRRWLDGGLGDVGAGPDQLVSTGEEALEQLPRCLVAGRARIDATEEDLDHKASDLRGEHPLHRLVEARHIERQRMTQCGRAGARGEGLVDVHHVERDTAEQPLQSSAHVDRQRGRAAPGAARQRDALPDRDHPRVLATPDDPGALLRLPEQPSALTNRLARIRRGDDQDSMSPLGQLRGGAGDELVDLVPLPPGMRSDLCDGQ